MDTEVWLVRNLVVNPVTVLSLITTLWPAVAGAAGAIYFASQGDYAQALTVLLTGLGLAHVVSNTSPPK